MPFMTSPFNNYCKIKTVMRVTMIPAMQKREAREKGEEWTGGEKGMNDE